VSHLRSYLGNGRVLRRSEKKDTRKINANTSLRGEDPAGESLRLFLPFASRTSTGSETKSLELHRFGARSLFRGRSKTGRRYNLFDDAQFLRLVRLQR
jgi:hypothetical protein